MSHLWVFLPEEAIPLILTLMVLGVVAGLVRLRVLIAFVLVLAMLPLVMAQLDTLMAATPWWLVVMIVIGILMHVVRSGLSLLLGTSAANHVIGRLAVAGITLTFRVLTRLLLAPFRLIR